MGMNTKEMIDIGLVRYGKPTETADARAEFLQFLNLAQRELWQAADWPFKREETTLSITQSTRRYVLPASIGELYGVKSATSPYRMTYVPRRTYQALYEADTATGVPTRWTVIGRYISGSAPVVTQQILHIWPSPTLAAAGNGTLLAEVAITDLADSTTNESRVPDMHRSVIVSWALMLMSAQQKNEFAQVYKAETERALEAMKAKYGMDEVRRK